MKKKPDGYYSEVSWKLSDGSPAKAEIMLQTRETVYLDGDTREVDVGRLKVSIAGYAKGRIMGYEMTHYKPPKNQGGVEIYGAIGRLGLRREQVEEIDRIVAQMKNTPEYKDFESGSAS